MTGDRVCIRCGPVHRCARQITTLHRMERVRRIAHPARAHIHDESNPLGSRARGASFKVNDIRDRGGAMVRGLNDTVSRTPSGRPESPSGHQGAAIVEVLLGEPEADKNLIPRSACD